MYELVPAPRVATEATDNVVSESVNVPPSLTVEVDPAVSISVTCDPAACETPDVCSCPRVTTASFPFTDPTDTISASINKRSATSKSVVEVTVRVVSVALNVVLVNCAVSMAFLSELLIARTIFMVPP